ncbi:ABC transporter substrate-binding protein [Mesorhizobium sp. IMUNJ 23232]|uniref:ABC transporter substrate-binding protein n=1 Tax=Mesorhizobium sp. IMUNJ 23232 TaxID=3376064 RepID=UPI0037CBEBCB
MRTLKLGLAGALALFATGALAQEKALRIGLIEDVDTLDPTQGGTLGGRQVFSALCDKLFDLDEKAGVIGRLATSHEVSADGLTITLKLRDGVKFHDGTPFDAEAVKFNIERALTLEQSKRKGDVRAVDTIEVVDPLTVKLHLKQPFTPLLAQLADRAGMMMSPTAIKAAADAAAFGSAPVCSGPYKLVERVVQDRIVLEKFPDYWNKDAFHFDEVTYLPVPDATVRLNNLLAGQLDLIEQVSTADLERVKADPRFTVSSIDGLGFFYLLFNLANGEGAKNSFAENAKLRQAIDAAIDRNVINQVAFGGNFTPGNQPVSPSSPYYDKSMPVPARDLDKAKALVAESGVADPTLEVTVNNNPTFLRVGQVIQSMAAEAGIKIVIKPIEASTAGAAVAAGEFQSHLSFWSGRADPDGNIYNYLGCKGSSNVGKYCNQKVDDILTAAAKEADPAKRAALYAEANKLWMPEAPLLVIYHSKPFFAAKKEVTGFKPIPDGLMRLEGVSME